MGLIPKLQAINRMLVSAGEHPVSDLSGVNRDISAATLLFEQASIDYQLRGQADNKFIKKFTPDANGKILIGYPSADYIGVLGVRLLSSHINNNNQAIKVRLLEAAPPRLWNITDNTDVFDTNQQYTVELTVLFSWEQLDTVAQNYIMLDATRRYQMIMQADADLDLALGMEQLKARVKARANDIRKKRRTIWENPGAAFGVDRVDGTLSASDIASLFGAYGEVIGAYDVNDDGVVSFADPTILVGGSGEVGTTVSGDINQTSSGGDVTQPEEEGGTDSEETITNETVNQNQETDPDATTGGGETDPDVDTTGGEEEEDEVIVYVPPVVGNAGVGITPPVVPPNVTDPEEIPEGEGVDPTSTGGSDSTTDPAEADDVSPYVTLTITTASDLVNFAEVGTGFVGATAQPARVGLEGSFGGTGSPVARWTRVQWEDVRDLATCGVAAYHVNGINRVEFSVNGGAWTTVYTPRFNPETLVDEYYITFNSKDMADGIAEVRAIVYPQSHGIPRVLQGTVESAGNTAQPNWLNVINGMHSCWLNVVNAENPYSAIFVSPDGNDSTGNGTEANPYKTLWFAISKAKLLPNKYNGAVIMCQPGDYTLDRNGGPSLSDTTQRRYLTIMPAEGVKRNQVRIVSAGTTGGTGLRAIKFLGVTLYGTNASLRCPTNGNFYGWHDRCYWYNDVSSAGGAGFSGNWTTAAATGCISNNVFNSFRSHDFVRNCKANNFGDTPLAQDVTVLNFTADNYIRTGADHADTFHWFYNDGPFVRENRLVLGVTTTNADCQGWQINPMTGGTQLMKDIAFVNLSLRKDTESANGAWWFIDVDHLLMQNVALHDQTFRWQLHSQDEDDVSSKTNIKLKDCEFAGYVEFVPVPGIVYDNCIIEGDLVDNT